MTTIRCSNSYGKRYLNAAVYTTNQGEIFLLKAYIWLLATISILTGNHKKKLSYAAWHVTIQHWLGYKRGRIASRR